MKRTFLFCAVILFATVSIIFSCKKKTTTTAPDTTNLNTLFSDLRSTAQTFTVTAGKAQTVVGKDSTVLIFYPNSFRDVSGNTITTGTVSIQLIEMYKPGDMVANRTSTTANGQLLQSGGQVHILATIGGQPVYANTYGIAFKQKAYSTTPMELYTGVTSSDSTTTWAIADTSKKGTQSNCIVKNDTLGNYASLPAIYYLFDSCTSFNSINCDHFLMGKFITSNIKINFSDNSFNSHNTQVYFIFPTINSSEMMWGDYNSGTLTYSNDLPPNVNFEIVIIANKNGTYYYYQQTGIPTAATISVNAVMATDTRADVTARLAGL